MRLFVFLLGLLITGCVSVPRPEAPGAAAPAFPVFQFFEGRTEGRGVLRIALRSSGTVAVQGRGRVERDGTLVLSQRVEQSGEQPRDRVWRIREVSPGRYSGTLSDASGPITGEVRNNRLHLRFRMRGGLDAEQWLTLAPDGRSARNLMTVRKLGLTVAALDETIRRID